MGDMINIIFNLIKMSACILGGVLMTIYYFAETSKLREQYNDPKSEEYQSQKVKMDLKTSFAVYILGMICLIAIAFVVFFV